MPSQAAPAHVAPERPCQHPHLCCASGSIATTGSCPPPDGACCANGNSGWNNLNFPVCLPAGSYDFNCAVETCLAGQCQGGSTVTCPPATDQCQKAFCDPATGCGIRNVADGTACNDGDVCTEPDTCLNGVCQGPDKCPAGVPCDAVTGICLECKKQGKNKTFLCKGQNGHGDKCCPVDTFCDISSSGSVNCRPI